MTTLNGRVALVTGAGTGIGAAAARALAERGAAVALHYHRSRDGAEQLASALRAQGGRTLTTGGDLTRRADVERVFADATGLGTVDILVNNAGDLVERRPLAEMSDDLWQRVFDLNVTSTFMCTQVAARHMVPLGRGAIVNMASLAAHTGGGGGAFAYATAKAAVIGFTRGVAKELAPRGVRVNAVAPGLIGQTGFHDRFTTNDQFDSIIRTIPVGRAGTPDDVGSVIAFLAGDESAFLAGETIEINGGAWFA